MSAQPSSRCEKIDRRIFVGVVVTSLVVVAGAAAPAPSDSTIPPVAQYGDYISAGFFSPPPGVRPVNRVSPSRFPGARRSYAWRYHKGKRELVEFSTPIQHIIVIYMENRTPEDLFGAYYNSPAPDGTILGKELDLVDPAAPTASALSPAALNDNNDPNHEHNGTKGFVVKAAGSWPDGYTYVETPNPTLSVPSVANYISIIENWAYDKHTLQSNEGPSFESHQYLIAGQSGGLSNSSITPQGMADNPKHNGGPPPGDGSCFDISPSVATLNMYSPYPDPSPGTVSPCNEYPSIVDNMASAAPTTSPYEQWQYVAFNKTSIWSAPMAIEHLFNAYNIDPDVNKSKQPFAVDPDAENFVLNITLSIHPTPNPLRPFAELTFLTPCMPESDHPNTAGPGGSGVDNGPQWLAWVLNKIGGSLYFPNTAIVVTWDDWGGFYDNYNTAVWPFHPTPNPYGTPTGNPQDPNEWGFRVPLILISPYVKKPGYISAQRISQGAILNFIEDTFGLGINVLGGDDLSNQSNDLTDMLNFSNTPLPWNGLPTSFSPAPVGSCPPAVQL